MIIYCFTANNQPLEMILLRLMPLHAAALALFLAGCGATPLTSLPALYRVDPATTELAALRAAVILPEALRPIPGSARITLRAMAPTGIEEASFALEPDTTTVTSDIPPRPGSRITGFRLGTAAIEAVEAFRHQAAARGVRRMSLGVSADACRMADTHETAWPVSTLLRTPETRGFVVLARFDLRQLVGTTAIADLPRCEAGP
jgi:hypothetical protein